VLASTASTAHAAPINYSESVSGDLPETTPPAVFTLDVVLMIVVAGLLDPRWKVEIEAEAIVAG